VTEILKSKLPTSIYIGTYPGFTRAGLFHILCIRGRITRLTVEVISAAFNLGLHKLSEIPGAKDRT
jgi:hypothetical protein